MIVGAGSSLLAASIVDRSLDAGWRAVTSRRPPAKPESLKTGWSEALLWTAVSALLVGLAQLSARRGAAVGWKQVTGRKPPK
jgi:Protein of unknown function (DUF4235)